MNPERSCRLALRLAPLALATAVVAQQADPGFLADTRQYLGRLEKLGFAGTVLIAQGGGPLLAAGYGLADREAGVPWTPATVSTIGSITKQFIGAAILRLEEQGRLRVEDPITGYFPDVPEDKRGITLHHLLTHSSGIVDLEGLGDWDPIDRDGFIRRALQQPLQFAPGTRYEYSNAGYSLLGAIVEQLTGETYERFLRDELLVPQGVFETGYVLPDWGSRRIAAGYRDGQRWGTVLERPLGDDGPYWVLRANGGVHSTAYDMLRWAEALRAGRVLSPDSMAKYWAPHVDEGGGTFYGYGWVVAEGPGGERVITHNGGNGILFADLAILPDAGLVLFLQTNVVAEFRGAERLLEQIGMRLAAGRPYPAVPDVDPSPRAGLEDLAGTYATEAGSALQVRAAGRGLVVEPVDPGAFALLHSRRPPDAGRIDRLSRRIDAIVEAFLSGDYGPIHAAYRGEVPLERLRDGGQELLRDLQARHGALQGHAVLGTALRSPEDVTVVRIRFERGAVDRAYVWDAARPEHLLGVSRRGLAPELRFLPVAGGGFASWDGGTSPSVPLRFEPRGDGGTRMRLGEGDRAVVASRRPRRP